MKVVDTENWAWFLFEHEGHLYLDAYCNMSAFGYTFMIQLNDDERAAYDAGGHQYLNRLAHEIHYSDRTMISMRRADDTNVPYTLNSGSPPR